MHGDGGNDTLYGDDGNDSLFGGSGNDELWGLKDNDYLNGQSGNDTLYGYDGNDRLLGEGGNDKLFSGYGDDFLNGGSNNDFINGEQGNDTLEGGGGHDTLYGGEGRDEFIFNSSTGGETYVRDFDSGWDVLSFRGTVRYDGVRIYDGNGADTNNDGWITTADKGWDNWGSDGLQFYGQGSTLYIDIVDQSHAIRDYDII